MPQIGDVDDLKEASFMALSSPPSTIEAQRFVDAIVFQIKANETRARARSQPRMKSNSPRLLVLS